MIACVLIFVSAAADVESGLDELFAAMRSGDIAVLSSMLDSARWRSVHPAGEPDAELSPDAPWLDLGDCRWSLVRVNESCQAEVRLVSPEGKELDYIIPAYRRGGSLRFDMLAVSFAGYYFAGLRRGPACKIAAADLLSRYGDEIARFLPALPPEIAGVLWLHERFASLEDARLYEAGMKRLDSPELRFRYALIHALRGSRVAMYHLLTLLPCLKGIDETAYHFLRKPAQFFLPTKLRPGEFDETIRSVLYMTGDAARSRWGEFADVVYDGEKVVAVLPWNVVPPEGSTRLTPGGSYVLDQRVGWWRAFAMGVGTGALLAVLCYLAAHFLRRALSRR